MWQADGQTDRHATTAKTALTHSGARVKGDFLRLMGIDGEIMSTDKSTGVMFAITANSDWYSRSTTSTGSHHLFPSCTGSCRRKWRASARVRTDRVPVWRHGTLRRAGRRWRCHGDEWLRLLRWHGGLPPATAAATEPRTRRRPPASRRPPRTIPANPTPPRRHSVPAAAAANNTAQHISTTESVQESRRNEEIAQRRRIHCALAVVMGSQKFSPRRRPPSRRRGGAGRPKFNQLEMVTTFTYRDPVWWRSMHAISSYRGNRPTNKQSYKATKHS